MKKPNVGDVVRIRETQRIGVVGPYQMLSALVWVEFGGSDTLYPFQVKEVERVA